MPLPRVLNTMKTMKTMFSDFLDDCVHTGPHSKGADPVFTAPRCSSIRSCAACWQFSHRISPTKEQVAMFRRDNQWSPADVLSWAHLDCAIQAVGFFFCFFVWPPTQASPYVYLANVGFNILDSMRNVVWQQCFFVFFLGFSLRDGRKYVSRKIHPLDPPFRSPLHLAPLLSQKKKLPVSHKG